jgi:hypothetical protein
MNAKHYTEATPTDFDDFWSCTEPQSGGLTPLYDYDSHKRLNPETNRPFKKGEVRSDGFIFRTYEKSKILENGYYKESWLSPEANTNFKKISKKAIDKCNKEKYLERRRLLDSIKIEKGCERCGYKESPCALDFAHKNPSTKLFTVSKLLLRNESKIYDEIAKCRILCSNCHRLETHGVISFDN